MSAFQHPAWPSSSLFLTATRAALPKLRQIPAPLCSPHTTSLGHYYLSDLSSSYCLDSYQCSSHTGLPIRHPSGLGRAFAFALPPPESLLLLNFCELCPLTFFRDVVKTVRARQLHLKPYLTAPSLLTFPTYHSPPITFQHTILFIVFTRV